MLQVANRTDDKFIRSLPKEIFELMDLHDISCKRLHGSKSKEVAFMYEEKRREFEVREMKNGKYRISTRMIGYKDVMEKISDKNVVKGKDPDGRRCSFHVDEIAIDDAIDLISKMLRFGFEANYRYEFIG